MASIINASTSTGLVTTADTSGVLQLQTGGTAAVTVDASQNVGIGVTPSAWSGVGSALQVGTSAAIIGNSSNSSSFISNAYFDGTNYKYIGTGFATRFASTSGAYIWTTAASGTAGNNITFTEAMRIDSSGNVGIGTSSPGGYRINVQQAAADNFGINVTASNGTSIMRMLHNGTVGAIDVSYTGGGSYSPLVFRTSDTERMRIDSSGNLLVGATVGGGFTVFYAATDCINSRSGAAAGNATSLFVGRYSATSSTSGTLCFNVTTNGNVTNANNSYGSLSDVKLKENIVDVSPKLADLMQVRIVNYNFKEGQTHKQIGVVAQELEQVFPSMIEENSDYEEVTTTDEDGNETTERVATGTTTKSVKYSVFVPMLIKAIQEQQAIIQTLTDRITALEGTTP